VSPTVKPCTKGLWIWDNGKIMNNQNEAVRLFYIDTEGIGSFSANETYDTQVS
jgi:hypothetical protein